MLRLGSDDRVEGLGDVVHVPSSSMIWYSQSWGPSPPLTTSMSWGQELMMTMRSFSARKTTYCPASLVGGLISRPPRWSTGTFMKTLSGSGTPSAMGKSGKLSLRACCQCQACVVLLGRSLLTLCMLSVQLS